MESGCHGTDTGLGPTTPLPRRHWQMIDFVAYRSCDASSNVLLVVFVGVKSIILLSLVRARASCLFSDLSIIYYASKEAEGESGCHCECSVCLSAVAVGTVEPARMAAILAGTDRAARVSLRSQKEALD